ncbi:hypothetical protein ODJ79_02950 [Actinoplanes sp. KI2]|uniref:hypothetical protein n=1 Tax=Actinoplanes sp. KI2 TaxID=2983315 RepID=UPI0021D5B81E|nr:hypothetical protein [Actinoplanes sp. KI2]MCU7722663.1 hypothetical protein [Actinoplanes sp. KI2]
MPAEETPPWALPRPTGEPVTPRRRLAHPNPAAETGRRPPPAGAPPQAGAPPPAGALPPAGPTPPPAGPTPPGARSPAGAAPDNRVGLIAGPVRSAREPLPGRAEPGLVAVAVTAVLTLAGTIGHLLSDRAHPVVLLAGVAMPLAFLAAAVLLDRWDRRAAATVHHFTLRANDATTRPYRLHGSLPAGALTSGDLVRLTPGRGNAVRAIEVLAALDGPVVRRLTGRPAVPPAQLVSLLLATALLATAAAILLGRI